MSQIVDSARVLLVISSLLAIAGMIRSSIKLALCGVCGIMVTSLIILFGR